VLHSPSWRISPYGCERLRIDGIYIYTDQKYGVWADGIDPDGCKDVIIANSTIETGDDAIVFYSMNWHGPPLPCENITITNCRLSSSSSAIKFCDGNMNAVRNVTITNCVITNSNRGIAFMVYDGGVVENVILFLATDPSAAYDRSVNAMQFRWARNLTVKDVEVVWEKPASSKWQSALSFEDVQGLTLDNFSGAPARLQTDIPAVVLDRVE